MLGKVAAAGGAILVVSALVVLAAQGPAPRQPNPAGGIVVAVLGDAPYRESDERRYELVLEDIDAHELAWVIHVGDTMVPPCTDARYQQRLDWFEGSRHPVIYTPGDNEWTDCGNENVRSGALDPLERLGRLRRVFFSRPGSSLGRRRLPLSHQGSDGSGHPELVENARWEAAGVVWATIHLVGSRNGRLPYPGRSAASDQEAVRRTAGAVAWLKATFARAQSIGAEVVVITTHADLALEHPPTHPWRSVFEPFTLTLEEEVERFGRPVLLGHGDSHHHVVDQPLIRRTTGRRLENLTRMEVPGYPDIGWVRLVITPGQPKPFAFEQRLVSRLRRWW